MTYTPEELDEATATLWRRLRPLLSEEAQREVYRIDLRPVALAVICSLPGNERLAPVEQERWPLKDCDICGGTRVDYLGRPCRRHGAPVEQPDEVTTPGALEPTEPYHGDGVPNTVLHDLRAIMAALGIDDYARPYSPHEVVQREVLPAIERLRSAPPVEQPPTQEKRT